MDFKYFSNQNVGALICSILKSIPPTPTYWVLVMKIAGSEKSQFGMRLGYYQTIKRYLDNEKKTADGHQMMA